MASARYLLPQHPTLSGPHTKEELYVLVERGSLGRGEIVVDRISGRSHKVGELIGGMRPPRASSPGVRIERPPYQEFSGDAPWEDGEDAGHEANAGAGDDFYEEEGEDDYVIDGTTGIDDATLCYHGHPTWLSFGRPLFLCIVLVAAATLVMPYGVKYFIIGLALASLTLCCTIIARQHRDYYVSGERVEVEWGIIGRNSKEIRIIDIRAIDVVQKGFLGFIGIGTLNFSSAGSDNVEVEFKNIRRPHRIKELVRQLQVRAEGGAADA